MKAKLPMPILMHHIFSHLAVNYSSVQILIWSEAHKRTHPDVYKKGWVKTVNVFFIVLKCSDIFTHVMFNLFDYESVLMKPDRNVIRACSWSLVKTSISQRLLDFFPVILDILMVLVVIQVVAHFSAF